MDAESSLVDPALERQPLTTLVDHLPDAVVVRILAVAGHELKAPLSPLRILIEHLQRQLERGTLRIEELPWALARMDAQVARLALLIDDLLDLGRLDRGHLALRRESLDLLSLARGVVDRAVAGEPLERPSHTIRLESSAEELRGRWDSSRLDQVLTNLLSNAIRYSAPGSTVTVRLEPVNDHARVSITDQGIGVPAEELGQLFEPFRRGRNAATMHVGGLGLGLAISKGIVERHDGRIRAESEEGRGSTFAVELPLDDRPDDWSGRLRPRPDHGTVRNGASFTPQPCAAAFRRPRVRRPTVPPPRRGTRSDERISR